MQTLSIRPSQLKGSLAIPPSKSQTMRAILFALMAEGKSEIRNALLSTDTDAMIDAVRAFGAKVDVQNSDLLIEGVSQKLSPAEDVINAQNSGIVLRMIGALAALLPTYTVITGDRSIRHQRPVIPLLNALEQLGAFAASSRLDGFAPILIRGPLRPGSVKMCGKDSQPVSALLIASAFLEGITEIEVIDPGERPWVDLTLSWLDRLNLRYEREGYSRYTIHGGSRIKGFSYAVPADFSSAAYPLAAALVTRSELCLEGLDFGDSQGDKKIIELLQELGAEIDISNRKLFVRKSRLKGGRIDVNDLIDALPLLAVTACYAETPTEIVGGEIARTKESDRIRSIAKELKKMGAKIEERRDGLLIYPSQLHGASLFSHHDHRIVFSLAVAALGAMGESHIEGTACTAKSYPTFSQDFRRIGGDIA